MENSSTITSEHATYRKVPVEILNNTPSTHSLVVVDNKIPITTPMGPTKEKNN